MNQQATRLLFTFLLICLFVSIGKNSYSQSDSCNLRFSLLTCSPGEELYSSFGHTAIRVTDNATGKDIVFNYGTFDDSDPLFYLKFTRGLMIYALSVYPYQDFEWEYKMQNRSVIEQVLQLSCVEKKRLFEQLQVNATEANRYYLYYFLNDNCTTRAKDMIKKNASSPVTFSNIIPADSITFRNLIHSYLDKSDQPWSKLGIDILLGSRVDKKMTNEESMFLPDYLMKGFDNATISSRPLVKGKQTVVPASEIKVERSWLRPLLFFSILLVIVAGLTWLGTKWAQQVMNVFDRIFFFALGLLGILVVTLWIIRVDTVCRDNFNLLWALPTHLYIAFVMGKNRNWIRKYFRITIIISLLTAITWYFIPQQLNPALLPLLLIIITRSFFRSKKP
jgi:amino acid transporter